MSSAARPLRLCLRAAQRAPFLGPSKRKAVPLRRVLSTTAARAEKSRDLGERGQGEGEAGQGEEDQEFIRSYHNPGEVLAEFSYDGDLTQEERAEAARMLAEWNAKDPDEKDMWNDAVKAGAALTAPLRRIVRPRPGAFWNEDEGDSEMITDELGEDDFDEDDITSMGHGKLEEHREAREYARVAVWEMPLLSKLAKPFEPPRIDQPLRFRYTSYLGEFHPAERKVAVEFSPKDLPLTEAQQLKLMKLAGSRYNPEKGTVKMSSDMFEHQSQNKRYLGDIVDKLIAEAKNENDMFEDIPLDTRHHALKVKPKFPREWRMTAERKKNLESLRQNAFLLDQSKRAEKRLVDGKQRIAQALEAPSAKLAPAELVAEHVQRSIASKQRPLRR